MTKTFRHYYWLVVAFFRKNFRFLILSFVVSFFTIILFINVIPVLQSLFFKEQRVIGYVGSYTYRQLPREIGELVSNPLVAVGQNGELVPVLVNSWEVLNDGKTYRFHLKTDLLWSNGDNVTAPDMSFNFRDVKVKPVDKYTLDFNLQEPLVIFPNYLSQPVLTNKLQGVGGLYRVGSFKLTGDSLKQINLVPNKEALPYLVYRFYQTDDDLITAYKKGEISEFKSSKRNIADIFENWKNTKVRREKNFDQIMVLFLNTESKLLGNIDVRRAVANAMPSFDPVGEPANGPLPPTSFAYAKENKVNVRNIEKAKSLIGKNLKEDRTVSLHTFFDHASIAEEIKASLEEAGLKVELKLLSFRPEDFDMFLTIWNPPRDPDQYFFWHSTQTTSNLTHLKSPKIDKLLEDGRQIINVKQRESIYHDFQRVLVEELPAVFLYYPYSYTIERK